MAAVGKAGATGLAAAGVAGVRDVVNAATTTESVHPGHPGHPTTAGRTGQQPAVKTQLLHQRMGAVGDEAQGERDVLDAARAGADAVLEERAVPLVASTSAGMALAVGEQLTKVDLVSASLTPTILPPVFKQLLRSQACFEALLITPTHCRHEGIKRGGAGIGNWGTEGEDDATATVAL